MAGAAIDRSVGPAPRMVKGIRVDEGPTHAHARIFFLRYDTSIVMYDTTERKGGKREKLDNAK